MLTQHAARSTQHAARSTQHAARSTQHAARSTQHAALAGLLCLTGIVIAPGARAVTNGSAAPSDKHVVHVSFANTKGTVTLCSGVLATPTRVVLAAHCLNGEQSGFEFIFASNDFGYLPGSPIKIRNEAQFPVGDFEGSPKVGDLASYTPTPGQPMFVPRAWETSSPMNFALPWMSDRDLAVIPLDQRVKLSSVTPAQLPFDPDGTTHACSSSFSGRFVGYGAWFWDGAQSYRTRQAATTSVFRSTSPISGHTYRAEFDLTDVIGGLLPEALGFSDAVQALLGSSEVRLIEPGDSGGPMFQGSKLCGINSAFELSPLSCNWTCSLDIPPVCGYFCQLTMEDVWTPTDTAGAVGFLQPLLTDSAGHYHGTCGPDAPAALADLDTDGDQIPDGCDPCPFVPDASYKATGVVTTGPDEDQDGVPDACDDCPTMPNPRDPLTLKQGDSDFDGVGDACDKCPHSDVRGESDFVCCDTDVDCNPGNPQAYPKMNRCVQIGTTVFNGLTLPNACAGFVGRCSWGRDFDGDLYADSCDNCRTQHNPDQADDDGDGAGNVCDNCAGLKGDLGPYPNEDHGADRNEIFAMQCLSDAQCVAKTGLADSQCSPAKLLPQPGGGVALGHRHCNKFADADGDGLGDACDSCPSVFNAKSDYGGVNNQANCNLDLEIARGEPYPYVGDACDPNPCTRTFEKASIFTSTSQDLWLTLSLQPHLLPNSVAPTKKQPASQAPFSSLYTGTPEATVGVRFCPCKVDGKLVGTVKDCELQCPLEAGEYGQSTAWLLPDIAPAPPNPGSLPASPPPGYFTPGAAFSGLVTEEPQPGLAAAPSDQLATFGTAPRLVSWDLGSTAVEGFGINVGKLGVLWTAVRDVPQMSPASPAVFRSHSNHYESNFYGKTLDLNVKGAALVACFWCQSDPCPHCATSMDIQNLLIDPTQSVVGAQGLTQSTDLTASFSSAALGALLEPDVRWLQAAERGGWLRSGMVGLVGLSPDGSAVRSALAQVAGLVQPVGRRATDDLLNAAVAEPPDSPGPAPRSDFGAALSAREHAVFVLGGKLASDGAQAGDVWRYGIESREWMRLPISGTAPRLVLAATYQPETRSLWFVDAGSGPGLARIVRLDLDTLRSKVMGLFPRAGHATRVELSNAPDGELLLAGSSTKLDRTAAVVLRPGEHHLFLVGGVFRAGRLALEPTLTRRGLTLPMSQPGGKVQNTFVAAEDVYFAPKKKGAGPKAGVPDCL